MFIPVERLINALLCARKRLSEDKRNAWLERLADPQKHLDVLAEMLPVARLHDAAQAEFEVAGLGSGNRTLDWVITLAAGPRILVDVKYRTRDLVEAFKDLSLGGRGPEGGAPPPRHQVSLLFRGTVDKFLPRRPSDMLQGAWVVTELKQERNELANAFSSLDNERLHFAVVTNWGDEGFILTRSDVERGVIEDSFRIRHSDVVFARGVSA
jgi:hypothetical protein